MTIYCTRRIEFDAAHRVMGHEGKCKYLHGHRYTVEASFVAERLDTVGRVVDFGKIKALLGGWIDEYWDHNTILSNEDNTLGEQIAIITNQDIFYLPNNPTAENMADYLLHTVCPSLFSNSGLTCVRIRLYETPQCFVEAF